MYNAQTQSSLLHGRNSITVRNLAGGDLVNLARVAFARRPTVTYAKEGGMMEWTFHAVKTSQNLGRYA